MSNKAMMDDVTSEEDDRAQPIRFVTGTYAGRKGWLRRSKRERAPHQIYVYVAMEDYVKPTFVNRESVELFGDRAIVKTFTDAMFAQHPKVEVALDSLVTKLATFDLDTKRQAEACAAFKTKLEAAVRKQEQKGPRANYKKVVFNG